MENDIIDLAATHADANGMTAGQALGLLALTALAGYGAYKIGQIGGNKLAAYGDKKIKEALASKK